MELPKRNQQLLQLLRMKQTLSKWKRSLGTLSFTTKGRDKLTKQTSLRRIMNSKGRVKSAHLLLDWCPILIIWGKNRGVHVHNRRVRCNNSHLNKIKRGNQFLWQQGRGKNNLNKSSLRECKGLVRIKSAKRPCSNVVSLLLNNSQLATNLSSRRHNISQTWMEIQAVLGCNKCVTKISKILTAAEV